MTLHIYCDWINRREQISIFASFEKVSWSLPFISYVYIFLCLLTHQNIKLKTTHFGKSHFFQIRRNIIRKFNRTLLVSKNLKLKENYKQIIKRETEVRQSIANLDIYISNHLGDLYQNFSLYSHEDQKLMMKSFQAACHILKTHAAAVAETTSQKTKMKMKKWSVKSPVDTYTRHRNRTGCHSLLADTEKDSNTLPLELVVEDAEEDED